MNYVNNKDMLKELRRSHKACSPTSELCEQFMLMAQRISSKGSYAGYTYREDMQSFAVMHLVRVWDRFDMSRDNPFSFFTTCINNYFKQYLNYEKKHRDIRDELFVENGLDPSYSYQVQYELQQSS